MSGSFANQSGMDLFGLFVNNFDINVIYELGWYAAQQWMVFISGVVIALAIGIRMIEEKVALIGEGRSNYTKAVMHILMIAVAIGLYFFLVWVVINFFNAIYGALDSSDSLLAMTKKLDTILSMLLTKDFKFSLSDIIDSAYAVVATCVYAFTYCLLVFTVLGMRIAHATLVSFCVFWGAIALPMSITTKLKPLGSFGVICLMALFWPIIDSFFMYLISGSFSVMLDRTDMGLNKVDSWSMGTLLFYMAAFAIINLFLAATAFSAPFVSYALASGTGNVTGMLYAFGSAGGAAGAVAASYLKRGLNNSGGNLLQKGGDKLGANLEGAYNNMRGLSGGAGPIDTSEWFRGEKAPSTTDMAGGGATSSMTNRTGSSQQPQPDASAARSSSLADTRKPGTDHNADAETLATTSPIKSPSASNGPSPQEREIARDKQKKQGKRGAIINNRKNQKGNQGR